MAHRPGKRPSTASGTRCRAWSPPGGEELFGAGGVPTSRHRHRRVSMQLRRAAVGVALVAMVVVAGCSGGGDGAGAGGGEVRWRRRPTPRAPGTRRPRRARPARPRPPPRCGWSTSATGSSAPPPSTWRSARAAERHRQPGHRRGDQGQGDLCRVVDVGAGRRPGQRPGHLPGPGGRLRAGAPRAQGLGTYRGEQSSTEDVTTQYVDLNGQLAAWRPRSGCTACSTGRSRSPT